MFSLNGFLIIAIEIPICCSCIVCLEPVGMFFSV